METLDDDQKCFSEVAEQLKLTLEEKSTGYPETK